MTTCVLARGSEWSNTELYDCWGEDTPDEAARELGELVVNAFEKTARDKGTPVYWFPNLSEVQGDNGFDLDPEDLVYWQECAQDEVWAALIYEDGSPKMLAAVREIVKRYNLEGISDTDF